MGDTKPDSLRAAFEWWYANLFCSGERANMPRNSRNGEYRSPQQQIAWSAYRVAHESGRQLGMEQARAKCEQACISIMDDLRVHERVRLGAAKCLSAMRTPPAGDSDTQEPK